MSENNKKEIDKISGVETTGHEWDGLKELNNPAPRWWLWVFYATIIWSVGYWVVYPSWPTISGATEGAFGWTQFKKLEKEQAEIAAIQKAHLGKFTNASLQDIMNDPELYAFAMAGGKTAFKENCATCHGSGGAGAKGYPNLNDDDWLWGGTVDDIFFTIKNGIRGTGEDTRISQMPAFGKDGLLKPDEINAVTDYVLTLSGGAPKSTHEQGRQIFAQNCASCHGAEGRGGREFGAPNLADQIWLYGGSRQAVHETVFYARKGVMPTWKGRLDENMMKMLAVYVHELGGGEADQVMQEPANVDGAGE
ncbi:MAG: cytochrome-c oxidase, cbb3-type subunit III [Alphaproteobacteria bacterium]|nr:cytochrome-c oxidase, cbb3-type subunit III [Alphaproteobacteria bacterium]